ncbi:uncharacterized protein B0I36DRAFT_371660 [Microdochium trichocladiopsis]|uniref:Nucleoside phosphorylase domain-containing protein n=1 Tax=Microdochium trichocladiopsis TaxID=1682393 RepID=A0A9P8YLZ2_9PEZI|nr:uncharacterized protein B0I36DRAFT_371660 [Microdochium trichocladiopsis]KAH7041469.1 hypothetical protein B0I36DRAFT_371660 [Microdochium trichocladiopsis]
MLSNPSEDLGDIATSHATAEDDLNPVNPIFCSPTPHCPLRLCASRKLHDCREITVANVVHGIAYTAGREDAREPQIFEFVQELSAIFVEFVAAQALLDEVHETLPNEPSDNNKYVLGRMGRFNVAIACLGPMGMNSAAAVSNNMVRTFPSMRLQLVVGVAGGVPTLKNDIRLGDVVFGSKVVQYDLGKTVRNEEFQSTATVYTPPNRIQIVLNALRAEYALRGNQVSAMLDDMLDRNPRMAKYATCNHLDDDLYENDYEHPDDRVDRTPRIHFGAITSGNRVVKNALRRDELGQRYNALCLEMEGAALQGNDLPFLVIRGICDYADSHKNKQWQPYAAAVAAACAKEFVSFLQPDLNSKPKQSPALSQCLPETNLDEQKKKLQKLMKSLSFEQIDARQANIKIAHARTCKWLLEKKEFQEWLYDDSLDRGRRLLWIKGKPGAGKSTIMKFALNHFYQQKNKKQQVVISFFFNARGDQMEKTVQGMYQSLVLQLLTQRPHLRSILESMQTRGTPTTWTVVVLQQLLCQAIQMLEQDTLVCFIDALDECHPDEIRDMVHFFEDLGNIDINPGLVLHVCFASRHYPHITVRGALELILDGQEGHEQDISDYIKDKLNIGTGKTVQDISSQIQAKAGSVFMWVVLVVKILNEQSDSGLHPAALRKELDRIPQDLHALFRDILQRDTKNRSNLLLCIQWVLFAQRPLTPEETYLAIHSGLGATDIISSKWDTEEITQERLRLFLLSSSKGLVEITKTAKPTVQFIHESVSDFLREGDGLRDVWPDIGPRFEALSHDALKSCCLHYLISVHKTSVLSKYSMRLHRIFRKWLTERHPLISYAVDNVLWHAEQAQSSGLTQNDFVRSFRKQVQRWKELCNATTEEYQIRQYFSDVSLLYLFAERDLANLVGLLPYRSSCLIAEQARYGSPLLAALATQSFQVVRLFLDAFRASGRTPLSLAAEIGNLLIAHLLIESGATLDLADHNGRTPLSFAVARGVSSIARLLIESGARLDLADHNGRTPLSLAAGSGDSLIMQHLIEGGASLDLADHNGRTPLSFAAEIVDVGIVQLLLRYGVLDLENVILKTLLEHGATVDARSHEGRTPLSILARCCHSSDLSIVEAMIEHGAAVDSQDAENMTPLDYAAANSNVAGLRDRLLSIVAEVAARRSKCSENQGQ